MPHHTLKLRYRAQKDAELKALNADCPSPARSDSSSEPASQAGSPPSDPSSPSESYLVAPSPSPSDSDASSSSSSSSDADAPSRPPYWKKEPRTHMDTIPPALRRMTRTSPRLQLVAAAAAAAKEKTHAGASTTKSRNKAKGKGKTSETKPKSSTTQKTVRNGSKAKGRR